MMGEAENSKLFVLACWSMTSVGLVIGSLGPLLVPISDTFHLRLAQMGLPIVSHSTGFLSANIFLAFFWKIHKTRIFLGLSSLVASLTLVSISLVRTPLLLLVTLFFVGTSQGLLHTSIYTTSTDRQTEVRRNRKKLSLKLLQWRKKANYELQRLFCR